MKNSLWIASSLAVVLAVAVAVTVTATHAVGDRRVAADAKGAAAGGVRRIVSVQPFVVEKPWTHVWRAEQPSYDAGYLVVLEVDSALVEPKQTEEPVLYAGDETVERINHGFESGRVVAIIPSPRGKDGAPSLDLARTPIWFGAPMLPERVDAAMVRSQRDDAARRGVAALAPPPASELLSLASRDDLDGFAGVLVLEHSAAEQDLGNGLLVPR
jgi:hypothetical protein